MLTVQNVLRLFNSQMTRGALVKAENSGLIPQAKREGSGAVQRRVWDANDLPLIGERYGFLKHFDKPMCVSVFTTKGGVLKTTLALNICRIAALHNIKTCAVGLDMQMDLSTSLGFDMDLDESDDLKSAIEKMSRVRGLADLAAGRSSLDDIILPTDLPTLSFIPETSELVSLEKDISNKNLRDFWLKSNVVDKLKQKFELIVLDCSPNWNMLVSNALVASDALISPLECKINNFRNYKAFETYLSAFKQEIGLSFGEIFVPTKIASNKKLSKEIRNWYLSNIEHCISTGIRESLVSEEAVANNTSLLEYQPSNVASDEMREVVVEIWTRLSEISKQNKNFVSGRRSLAHDRQVEV